jgi:hypothetical protein
MSISTIGTSGGPFPSTYRSEVKTPVFDPDHVQSPERKERVAEATRRSEALIRKAAEMEESSKLETVENKVLYSPNVATLTREQALKKIETMREMIQSGESEQIRLQTGYGEKTTNNYRQYVYWLQQHVKELEGAQSGMDMKA